MTNREPRFVIGQQYMSRGKNPNLCTITDILKTYNHKGELVKIRYVSEHLFAGQVVVDYDVVETTIAMGRMDREGNVNYTDLAWNTINAKRRIV